MYGELATAKPRETRASRCVPWLRIMTPLGASVVFRRCRLLLRSRTDGIVRGIERREKGKTSIRSIDRVGVAKEERGVGVTSTKTDRVYICTKHPCKSGRALVSVSGMGVCVYPIGRGGVVSGVRRAGAAAFALFSLARCSCTGTRCDNVGWVRSRRQVG